MGTTIQQLRHAERDGDWLRVKVLCIRLHYTKPSGIMMLAAGCPHCDMKGTGIASWDDKLTRDEWEKFVAEPIPGYLYRCGSDILNEDGTLMQEGCGGLFVQLHVWSPQQIKELVQPNPAP